MFAYFLLILISLTVSLHAQIANVVPEKNFVVKSKSYNLGVLQMYMLMIFLITMY
jgi:hypothetical protein